MTPAAQSWHMEREAEWNHKGREAKRAGNLLASELAYAFAERHRVEALARKMEKKNEQ
jgi:hypothetical protein